MWRRVHGLWQVDWNVQNRGYDPLSTLIHHRSKKRDGYKYIITQWWCFCCFISHFVFKETHLSKSFTSKSSKPICTNHSLQLYGNGVAAISKPNLRCLPKYFHNYSWFESLGVLINDKISLLCYVSWQINPHSHIIKSFMICLNYWLWLWQNLIIF